MNPYGLITLPWFTLGGLLLLFHFWYDYHVQGNYISAGKRTSNWLLGVHSTTWTLTVSVPLYLVGTLTIEQFVMLWLTHTAMDWTKCHRLPNTRTYEVLDQVVHLVTLAVCLWQW